MVVQSVVDQGVLLLTVVSCAATAPRFWVVGSIFGISVTGAIDRKLSSAELRAMSQFSSDEPLTLLQVISNLLPHFGPY